MVNAAMGNNPCIFTRICQLVKFAKVSQQCIDDHYSRGRNISGGDLERFQTMTNKVAISHLKVLAKYSPTYTWSSIYLISLMFDRVEAAYGKFVSKKVMQRYLAEDGSDHIVNSGDPAPHPQSFFAMTNRCLSNLYNKKKRDTSERIRLTREEIEIEVLTIIPQDRIVREAALCLLDKLYAARPSVTTSIALGILNTVGSHTILVKVFGKVLQDFLHYEMHFAAKFLDILEMPCRYMSDHGRELTGICTLFENLCEESPKWKEASDKGVDIMRDYNAKQHKRYVSNAQMFYRGPERSGRVWPERSERKAPERSERKAPERSETVNNCEAIEDDGNQLLCMNEWPEL